MLEWLELSIFIFGTSETLIVKITILSSLFLELQIISRGNEENILAIAELGHIA